MGKNLMIKISRTKWDELQNYIKTYFEELGYKNDGFHNGMMFEGEPYLITFDDENAGFFSVGNSWDGGKMLRGFYVIPSKRRFSREIFDKIMVEFQMEAALVASNDAHFVSLAFEKMNALKTFFDMQAFNFVYGEPMREAEYGMECMKEVDPAEYESMNRLTENQWDGCFEDESFKFYKIVSRNETLGYGGMGKLAHNPKNVDVGNFVLSQHRRNTVNSFIVAKSRTLFLFASSGFDSLQAFAVNPNSATFKMSASSAYASHSRLSLNFFDGKMYLFTASVCIR